MGSLYMEYQFRKRNSPSHRVKDAVHLFSSLAAYTLPSVSLSSFSPRLQVKVTLVQTSLLSVTRMHQNMTQPLVLGHRHDCGICSFHLTCRTWGIGRVHSSLLKGQGKAQMFHLCHNNYINLMLTDFFQLCSAIFSIIFLIFTKLHPRTAPFASSQCEDWQQHFIGETVKAGN